MNTDSEQLRVYLKQIAKIPHISQEKVNHYVEQLQQLKLLREAREGLTKKLRNEPSLREWAETVQLNETALDKALKNGQQAKKKLVEANLRLVVSIAKKYHTKYMKYQRRHVDLLVLIQEGAIGLAQGVENFDPSKGNLLSTHCYWWIRKQICMTLDNQTRYTNIFQSEPTSVLDCKESKVSQPEETVSQLQRQEFLKELITAELSERTCAVLSVRFGLTDGMTYSIPQTAKKLGITVDQARYAYKTGLKTLQKKRLVLASFIH